MKLPAPPSFRSRRLTASVHHVAELAKEGRYEEAEAEARACEAAARRLWRQNRRRRFTWYARTMATTLACAHGRGDEVLAEMESLIAELDGTTGSLRRLLLLVRHNRAAVLGRQGRHAEAEAELQSVLRELTHHKRVATVWNVELTVLDSLAEALCGLGRHEEAEAIARGNQPRAEGVEGVEGTAAALHCTLVRSLNGQGRFAEALAEAGRFTPKWERGHAGKLALVTAVALHGLGRDGEAEAAARQALTCCEAHLHPSHPRLAETRALLALITADPGTPS
ncbi:tetratricopeptide repeat protein [Streptomyces sp. NPDC058739]|uniref:tetratricopeptide repeat protein n=1 Tax=Streptomyces sp. NPDC058739 TaxID=3346618 RepID=UPI00368D0193